MVNFKDVIFNTLWIVGLAIILAIWSYARYTAYMSGERVKDKFDKLAYILVRNCGLLLFLIGMALTEHRLFAKILWFLLFAGVLVVSGIQIQQKRSGK
jgi:hypothetical protein